MRSWHRDTATRLRPTVTRNAHGAGRVSWSTPEESPLSGLRITPLTGSELDGTTEVTHRLWAPADTDLEAGDRLRWADPRGRELILDVVGVPLVFRGVTGTVANLQVTLKAVNV